MGLRTPPATAKGPATTFTGDVWLDRFADGGDEVTPRRLNRPVHPRRAYPLAFTPFGQTLHCTDGVGLVATRDGRVIILPARGQTVWTPPGEEHWHGATRRQPHVPPGHGGHHPRECLGHLVEAVTDEQYASAQAQVSAGLAEEPTP